MRRPRQPAAVQGTGLHPPEPWKLTCADATDTGAQDSRYLALRGGLAAAQRRYDTLERVDALPQEGLMPLASLTLAEEEPILIRPGRTVAGQYDADSLADVLAQLEQQWLAEQGELTLGTDAPASRL